MRIKSGKGCGVLRNDAWHLGIPAEAFAILDVSRILEVVMTRVTLIFLMAEWGLLSLSPAIGC